MLVSSVSACGPRVAVCPPPEAPAPVASAPVVVSAAPPEKTLCWAKGKPRPIAFSQAPAGAGCRPFTEQLLVRAEARIRKETPITVKPSRLYIDVQCDPTTAPLRELVYEDADATSGTLRIVQLRELDDGNFHVRLIQSVHAGDQRRVELKGGTLTAAELRVPVEAARISLHVRPNLVATKTGQAPTSIDGTNSARGYMRVTVEDADGHVADRIFVGHPSVSSLHQRLPIMGAISAIDEALAKARTKLAPVEETDDDRAMYQRRLALALGLPPGESWVKERYVNLATTFGTVDAIPLIVPLLAPIVDEKPRPNDEAVRDSALEAIAVITGWNPRVGPDGKQRSTSDAAAIASDECAPSSSSMASSEPEPVPATSPSPST